MRDRDRWWWLLLTGLAFSAGGVVLSSVGARSVPTDNPYMTSADYWLLIGEFGLIALVGLGGA